MKIPHLFLFLSCLLLIGASSVCYANDHKTVEVVGFGECTDCSQKSIKTSQAFSGLSVTIECKTESGKLERRGAGELNEEGKFTVSIPKEIVKDGGDELKEECYAKLHDAKATPCGAHDGIQSTKVVFTSKDNDGKQTFGIAGTKLKFSPANCASDFFWHHFKHPKIFPPIYKKPLPPLVPIYKPPPVPVYKKPLPPPVPIYKPPPVPVYKKPCPPLVPVYKPPPVKKPCPPPTPVYKPTPVPKPHPPKKEPTKKPCPPPVPKYKKPLPPPVYTKPLPPPVYTKPLPPPVYTKPLPPPVYTKPLPPPIPYYKPKPHPSIPYYKPKPHPWFKHPYLKPLPPFPKIPHHPFFKKPPPFSPQQITSPKN